MHPFELELSIILRIAGAVNEEEYSNSFLHFSFGNSLNAHSCLQCKMLICQCLIYIYIYRECQQYNTLLSFMLWCFKVYLWKPLRILCKSCRCMFTFDFIFQTLYITLFGMSLDFLLFCFCKIFDMGTLITGISIYLQFFPLSNEAFFQQN